MKVKEFIELLSKCDGESDIFIDMLDLDVAPMPQIVEYLDIRLEEHDGFYDEEDDVQLKYVVMTIEAL